MASVDGSKSVQASSDEGHEFECDPCKYDDDRKEAVSFCMQCGEYLCSTCCTTHKKLSMSRNHQVVSGSTMPRKGTANAVENAAVKCSCNCKNVTIYCKEHNDIMCDDCQRLKHRACKTMSIDQASKQVKLPRKEDTLNNVNKLKETVESLKINRNKDNETLEIKSSECRRKIKDFSQELREKIAKLEKAALDEVADYETKHRKEIEQHIDTCTTAITKLEIDYQLLESTPATEDNLLFIRNLQLKKTMEHVEQALEDMEREVTKPCIYFEGDTSILRSDVKSLGNVNTTTMSTSRTVIADMTVKSTTKRPVIADMSVKSTRKLDVNDSSDSAAPWITGSVFMPNGELLLCDFSSNTSVKQFNTDFVLKKQIKLASCPWDIDSIADDEVVISLPGNKSLIFLKVFPKLQQVSSIQLDQKCLGVAVDGGTIFVSFNNGEVRVLDRAGNQLKNLYSLQKFKLPYYISVPKPGMLCVSENNAHTIRMLNNGEEVYTYKHSGWQYPLGMYIDGGNNVLICGYNSHNVHVIDSNGKHKKVLLTKNDGLNQPYTISFRSSDNTLVVGGIMGSNILVCKLS